MQHPGIWPEPDRATFDSDEDHARAWLQWAERTPGGWRARLAEKSAALAAGRDGGLATSSPCCAAAVLVDPLTDAEHLGICTQCDAVLELIGGGWRSAAARGD